MRTFSHTAAIKRGETDNISAFNADVAAQEVQSICVYFPSGTYRFSSQPTITFANSALGSATIIGDGREVSNISMDTGVSGPAFVMGSTLQSVHVRSLSVLAGGTSTTTSGISATLASAAGSRSAQSDITAVTVRGVDGYDSGSTKFFGTGVLLTNVSAYNFIDDVISGAPYAPGGFTKVGTCVTLASTGTNVPIVFNFVATQINYCKVGILYGPRVQGGSVTASNFTGNSYGIQIPAGQTGNDQLSIVSSQFNNGVANIDVESVIDGVAINGNDFYTITPNGVSIALSMVDSYAITGNDFIGLNNSGQKAIVINGGVGGTVVGNQFKGSGFVTCVTLLAGSANANVQANSYAGSCRHVANAGTGNSVGVATQ